MIQCKDCEFFHQGENGEISFSCDPFTNVKESECLMKWQIIKTNEMVATYQRTLDYYRRLAPMQEQMFKVVKRELEEMNESDRWKAEDEETPEDWPGEEDDDLSR